MVDKAADAQYFRVAHPIWQVLILVGLTIVTLCPFRPDLIPYQYMGPFGWFVNWLNTTYPNVVFAIFVVAFILHVGEALFAIKLCQDKMIESPAKWKWTVQTFFFGIASLGILLKYKPKKQP
ncbi:transmembrane protein 254-like [Lineus longissimus]|uniref:transmembrane protein 254-like n=1 Tax=Lineus longissimus TaxID=88925 RepID=UPI002B4DE7C6